MPKKRLQNPTLCQKLAVMAIPSLVSMASPIMCAAWLPEMTPVFKLSVTTTKRHHNTRNPSLIARGVISKSSDATSDEPLSHHQSNHRHHSSIPDEEDVFGMDQDKLLPTSSSLPSSTEPYNITREVMKKVRVAKAQAEIDRILQGPDAPVDTEAEFEKVISMNHVPSEQPLLDAQLAQLESDLYQAVKRQDFTMASAKKGQLEQLQRHGTDGDCDSQTGAEGALNVVDDGGAILQVNAAFYRAFSKKSSNEMDQVWLKHDGDTCICIHPGHPPIVGARRISKSWKQLFASVAGSFQRNWMEPHKIRIMQQGSHMAIVTCEEHVFARRFVRGKKRQTELINKLLTTNIFRKVNQQWYMFYHHASWHPDSEAAKRAFKSGGAGSTTRVISSSNDDYTPTSSLAATLAAKRRRQRRQLEDQDMDEDSDDTVVLGGILGNEFGPILGYGPKQGDDEKPRKRIIMGASLSDFLNDGLTDLWKGKDGASNSNNNGLPKEGPIFRFARMQQDDEDEDDDEIDDEDDDDELDMMEEIDDDEEEDSEVVNVAIIKEWAKSSAKRHSQSKVDESNKHLGGTNASTSHDAKDKKTFKDSARQRCVKVLRKLGEQGSISPRQKQVLLTDIITCSSRDEVSMVEIAYELLFGEGNDHEQDDAAEEEFADQCRIFARERLQDEDREVFDQLQ